MVLFLVYLQLPYPFPVINLSNLYCLRVLHKRYNNAWDQGISKLQFSTQQIKLCVNNTVFIYPLCCTPTVITNEVQLYRQKMTNLKFLRVLLVTKVSHLLNLIKSEQNDTLLEQYPFITSKIIYLVSLKTLFHIHFNKWTS